MVMLFLHVLQIEVELKVTEEQTTDWYTELYRSCLTFNFTIKNTI